MPPSTARAPSRQLAQRRGDLGREVSIRIPVENEKHDASHDSHHCIGVRKDLGGTKNPSKRFPKAVHGGRLMAVSEESSRFFAAVGAILAVAVGGLLAPARDWLGATNVALCLAVVVVGAAIFGGRLAGGVTSIAAAVSFDFFHTKPYYDLRIDKREDIIAAALLLVMGVAVGQLAMSRYGAQAIPRSPARGAAIASKTSPPWWPLVPTSTKSGSSCGRALSEQLDLGRVSL